MTPAEIMATFERQGPLPRAAIEAARQEREAMVPVFLDYIDRLQQARTRDLDGMDAFIFVFFLLAEWREPRAYRPLARLLRRDPDFLEALLGDSITEASARVMAGVFDGDLQPIFEVLLDDASDIYVRGEMFDTLVILALETPGLRPQIEAFLTEFFDLTATVTGEEIWWPWAECIAALGLAKMETAVRAVFDSGLITSDYAHYEDFTEFLGKTTATGYPDWFTQMPSNQLITDTIAELSSWYCFSPEFLARQADQGLKVVSSLMPRGGDPFEGVVTGKTGRNDPCPCGSGKKFKKCCLQ